MKSKIEEIQLKVKGIISRRFYKKKGRNSHIDRNYKLLDKSSIEIGNNSHILAGARIQNVSGRDDDVVTIGNNTGIGFGFTALAGNNITIGNNVAIASDVFLSAGSHGIIVDENNPYGIQKYVGEAIEICDNAWLGEKCCILSGVRIGKFSIIGAGAVVTKSIPDYSIAVGNPAKVIKQYSFKTNKWETVTKKER